MTEPRGGWGAWAGAPLGQPPAPVPGRIEMPASDFFNLAERYAAAVKVVEAARPHHGPHVVAVERCRCGARLVACTMWAALAAFDDVVK